MRTQSADYRRLVKGLFRFRPPDSDEPGPYRESLEETARLFTVPKEVVCRRDMIAGVPVEWVEPPNARGDALLLYLHGGGYYMGGIATYRHFVARFAQIAGMRALHVDYRLAPEHPYPAAVEDATAVFRALTEFTTPASRIVIAGDSAGGGLTLATLLALRDARHALPRAAAVVSPWTDLTSSGASFTANQAKDPIIGGARTRLVAGWYAGKTPRDHELVSPLFANLAGLPPLLIHVGTEEVLLDDSTRFAERAQGHGVPVTVEVWEGMVHVWHYYAEWIPEGREALGRIAEFFSAHLDDSRTG
jgi:acetyl esterase/lipase